MKASFMAGGRGFKVAVLAMLAFAVFSPGAVSGVRAQTAVVWDFGTTNAQPAPAGLPPEVGGGVVTRGNNHGAAALLTTTSVSSGYSGASGRFNAGATARTGAFNPGASAYFEFTFAPGGDVRMTVATMRFGSRSTATGPRAYAIYTNLDNFAVPVATGVLLNNSVWALQPVGFASVVEATGVPVTFRLFGFDGVGSSSSGPTNWRIDDLQLTILTTGGPGVLPPVPPAPPLLRLHEIQGAGSSSPRTGQRVTVRAVVTASFLGAGGPGGFFLEEEAWDRDLDEATSEGIFVFANGLASSATLTHGEVVELTGTVVEYDGLTELTGITALTKLGTALLPPAVALTLPRVSVGDLESWEGMRVRWPQTLFVTDTEALGQYGEFSVSAGGVLSAPTNIVAPGAAAIAQAGANALNRLVIDDGSSRTYPEPTPFVFGGAVATENTLRIADSITDAEGVLTFMFGSWRLEPTTPPICVRAGPRASPPPVSAKSIRVVSANLFNFFNGDGAGGGFPTSRGADSAAEFARQRAHIVAELLALNADIAGLIEIENDGFGPTSAIHDLVGALNAGLPVKDRYTVVDLGGPVGTDEITCGLIYKPARVKPAGAAVANVDPVFNRPPIAQTWMTANGERFTTCLNHFKSKSGPPAGGSDADQQDGQGPWNATRVAQARALAAWLAGHPTGKSDPDVLTLGDLNSYAKEDPLSVLRDAGYTNVIEALEGEGGWSFVFGGEAGHLDHALATASLYRQIAAAFTWHNNSSEPACLDYNLENKTAAQQALNDGATPWRASDHDPIVVDVKLGAPIR